MRLFLGVAIAALTSLVPVWQAAAQSAPETVRIGVVADGPSQVDDAFVAEVLGHLEQLTDGAYVFEIPDDAALEGEWTPESIAVAGESLMKRDDIDLVIGHGALTASVLATFGRYSKPVMAGQVFDPALAGMPLENGRSGVRNFTYLTLPFSGERTAEIVRDLLAPDDLAMLVANPRGIDLSYLEPIVERVFSEENVTLVSVGADAVAALAAVPEGAVAYVLPQPHLVQSDLDALWAAAREQKIPTFVHVGTEQVEAGALAAVYPSDVFDDLSRRVAVNIYRTLEGEDPKRFEVAVPAALPRLTINIVTARTIGLRLDWQKLLEADVVGFEEVAADRAWTLDEAIAQVLEANPDLAAARQAVVAAEAQQSFAYSGLMPTIDATVGAVVLDEDRASAINPEWSASVGVSATQPLYLDEAWYGLEAASGAVEISAVDQSTAELELVTATIQIYLALLSVEEAIDVNRRAVRRSRSYLELAHTQVQVGAATLADIYRWETELGGARKALIDAISQRMGLQQQFNQLLARPIDERVELADVGFGQVVQARLAPYVRDPWSFEIFVDFAVEEALRQAPELAQLDATIAIKEEELGLAQRAFFVPDLFLAGDLSYRFWEAGTGADQVDAPGAPDALAWSVALQLSIPLFEGLGRVDTIDQVDAELVQLQAARESQVLAVEQRLRAATLDLFVSGANITIDRATAESSANARDLVADAYSRGAVPVTDLIDAEQQAFAAERAAAASRFTFLSNYVAVERATGELGPLQSDAELDDFFARLERHFADAAAAGDAP